MRCFTMTFPALPLISCTLICGGIGQHLTVGNQRFMAPDAVILHYFLPGFFDKYHLRLCPQGKNSSMPQAVFGFEIVFIEKIIVGNMAAVTISFLTV